ncbi:MAG: HEAT repeat domain-containing protein, partial [Micrococcales bacterium]|nr:HEAT repeat domain-containing protein [Micrococcales bacterium]
MHPTVRAALLVLLAACGSGTPEPSRAGRVRTPRGPIPPAVLQANVLGGLPPTFTDPCLLAMALEPVDDDRAGQRLDQTLLELTARSQRTARESVCALTLAQARLLRLARLGRLDLRAELARPEPDARVVALLEVRRRRDAALLPAVRELIRDPQVPVASAAVRAIVAMSDRQSMEALRMLAIDPTALQLHGLACRALWDMGDTGACGGRPRQDEPSALLGSSGGEDPCSEARQRLRSHDAAEVQRALGFFLSSQFVGMTHEIDPVWISCTNCEPGPACRPSRKRLRRIAKSGPSLASAFASAVLLLR